MHMLENIATGHVETEEELFAFYNRTFCAFTCDVHSIRGNILDLREFLDPAGRPFALSMTMTSSGHTTKVDARFSDKPT